MDVENSYGYHVTPEGSAIVKSRAQFESTIVELWRALEVGEVGGGRQLGSRKETMEENPFSPSSLI